MAKKGKEASPVMGFVADALRGTQALMSAFRLYARDVARGTAQLIFERDGIPRTDGARIYLPMAAAPAKGSDWEALKRFAVLLWCFLVHELAHVRFTDMRLFKDSNPPLHRALLNGLEDVRIENAAIAVSPATAETLDAGAKILLEDGWFDPSKAQEPAAILSNYALVYGRYAYRHQRFLKEAAELAEAKLAEAFPPAVGTRLRGLMQEMPQIQSTQGINDLVVRILAMLEQEKEPPKQEDSPPPEQGDQPDAGDGQQSSQTGDSPSPIEAGEGGQQDGQGQQQGKSSKAGQGSKAPSSSGGNPDVTPDKQAEAQRQAVKDALAAQQISGSTDMGDALSEALKSEEKAMDSSVVRSTPGGGGGLDDAPPSIGYGPQLDTVKLKSCATQARSRITELFEAVTSTGVAARESGRRFHGRSMWRGMLAGQQRVFRHTDEGIAVSAAVQILLDTSSSMSGEPMKIACEAAFTTAATLFTLDGIALSVGTFPGRMMLLDFETDPSQCARNFRVQASGGTPLLPALEWTVRRLGMRSETRKIVVVITDGMPNSPDQCRQMISDMQQVGIEALGIGIGKAVGIGSFIPNSKSINQVQELPAALLQTLKAALFDYQRRAA